jgi:hypothetical protein
MEEVRTMRVMQVKLADGTRRLVIRDGSESWYLDAPQTTYDLARRAEDSGTGIEAMVRSLPRGEAADPELLFAEGRVLSPIDHPDPAHLMVSGTGLTHLGSGAARDAMHKKAFESEDTLTDSMKMFRMGLEGGKPAAGEIGIQPEWFYKGDGTMIAQPRAPLVSPSFADDGGEKPEVCGIYLIGKDGTPLRIGFALCNEFSDHVMERKNYLLLAHSKLRPCALGPELLLGDLPDHVEGVSRILRDGKPIFDKPFVTGEANMSYSIANIEGHHFKYALFRRPGDVHVHTFGTSTVSFAESLKTQAGDVFHVESPLFGLPMENPLAAGSDEIVFPRSL